MTLLFSLYQFDYKFQGLLYLQAKISSSNFITISNFKIRLISIEELKIYPYEILINIMEIHFSWLIDFMSFLLTKKFPDSNN